MSALFSSLDGLEDIFSGHGGSQNQGTPSTAGPGDGGKNQTITRWLSAITGAYEAVTGAGTESGPAPAPQSNSSKAPSKTPWLLYAGIAVGVGLLFWLFKRK